MAISIREHETEKKHGYVTLNVVKFVGFLSRWGSGKDDCTGEAISSLVFFFFSTLSPRVGSWLERFGRTAALPLGLAKWCSRAGPCLLLEELEDFLFSEGS